MKDYRARTDAETFEIAEEYLKCTTSKPRRFDMISFFIGYDKVITLATYEVINALYTQGKIDE